MNDNASRSPRRHFSDRARHLPKRDRTRARIIDAAVSVIARNGFEAATANDIAREAEIANGTFYLHFRDSDDAAVSAAFAVVRDVLDRVAEEFGGVEDAAKRVAFIGRRIVDIATKDGELGWAWCRAILSRPEVRRQVTRQLRRDLRRGQQQGVFTTEIDETLVGMIVAMVSAAIVGRLTGEMGPEAETRLAELLLSMLGVPAARAREIATGPLTPPAGTEFRETGK